MEEAVRVTLLGILCVLLATQMKALKQEYATYLAVGLGVTLLVIILRRMNQLSGKILELEEIFGENKYFLGTLMKLTIITYICEFGAGICKDAGYSSLAGQVEMFGKLAILSTGIPILYAVIEQLQTLM